jgi:2-hydroxy-6-oxonona-2,4-dienedioate hydrolase
MEPSTGGIVSEQVLEPDRFWLTVRGLRMYGRAYRKEHAPPPIVLVHGVGVSGRYMLPTARELAAHHPVYVPDLPGFGRSEKPRPIHKVADLADDLAGWLHALGLSGTCLVGNSMGCQTIVDLALRYPELARWAVLVGPTGDPRAASLPALLLRGGRDMIGEPLHYWPLLMWDYLRAGPIRTLATLDHALHDPLLDKLARLPIPTLVVRGTRDPIAPQRWVEEMVARLPHGRLLVIPGATHALNYAAPGALAQAVRDFVSARLTGDDQYVSAMSMKDASSGRLASLTKLL